MSDPVRLQREYYRRTAERYDSWHLNDPEHAFALAFMTSMITFLGIRSVLDVGTGTGRVPFALKQSHPSLRVVGIEPSSELRELAYIKGLSGDELTDGDAHNLPYQNGAFDLVCEFSILHHLPNPSKAVREMLRVARKALFISDVNTFGMGRLHSRFSKQLLRMTKLWPIANFVRTRGRGYSITADDGVWYRYSVFDDYSLISSHCASVHIINTSAAGSNLFRSAPHLALLGIKPG